MSTQAALALKSLLILSHVMTDRAECCKHMLSNSSIIVKFDENVLHCILFALQAVLPEDVYMVRFWRHHIHVL
jgi:hypothetical protein